MDCSVPFCLLFPLPVYFCICPFLRNMFVSPPLFGRGMGQVYTEHFCIVCLPVGTCVLPACADSVYVFSHSSFYSFHSKKQTCPGSFEIFAGSAAHSLLPGHSMPPFYLKDRQATKQQQAYQFSSRPLSKKMQHTFDESEKQWRRADWRGQVETGDWRGMGGSGGGGTFIALIPHISSLHTIRKAHASAHACLCCSPCLLYLEWVSGAWAFRGLPHTLPHPSLLLPASQA